VNRSIVQHDPRFFFQTLGDGLHGTPEYTNNGEYYFVNGNNLINGKIEFKGNTKTVSFAEYTKYKKEMNTNTILVSINGTLGNLAFYDGEKIILGKSACYFNLLKDVNKYFIGFLIKSQYFLKYAVDVASETTIKNVSLKSMRYLPVPLPPLAEQERIVAKLEKLMKFCGELEANIKQGKARADQLLQIALKEALEPKEYQIAK
jgi:type I restriction enzyme S subunit